ncbi:MAG: sugar phosphate isomerase/epimerase [Ginsengibacter sp.]
MMNSRRNFLKASGALAAGALLLPKMSEAGNKKRLKHVGVQLYTVRKEMLEDNVGTLRRLAALGFKEIESAASDKGYYYGLAPAEMKKVCKDLGMTLRSGHVHFDDKWQKTIDDAKEAGQEYLIVSSMPTRGQTVDNYKKVADAFNGAGETCKKSDLKFGYHNHEYEFEKDGDKVLFDLLLESTNPEYVNFELDLGWVIVTGNDPLAYFEKYPNRFPLWHLKDMDMQAKHSTEFGKGGLDIKKMLAAAKSSGMKYYFVEQEEYTSSPFESLAYNYNYLKTMKT